ncbi:uncharacterized protein LOC141685846 [Apium graveolens]|uniref:uncharacterized protein LOC141685846 n=1 Tax=Apium graveolens TaxID=4045 RepID=UPI003D7B69D5
MTDTSKSKDGPIGLNYPMLAKNNYSAWSLKVKVFIQAQGVWEAVEPDDPKAPVSVRTDKVELTAIYQGIPEDMLLSLAEKKTAKEAWEAIKTQCMGADCVKAAKVQTLRAEFESLSKKETDEMEDFYMKLSGIVTNIHMLVGRLKANEERVRGQTENTSQQLLLTQEEWLKRSNKNGESSNHQKRRGGFDRRGRGHGQFRGGNGGRGRGYHQHQNDNNDRGGHESHGRGNYPGRDKSKMRCYNCQKFGHFAMECRKPKQEKETSNKVNLSQIKEDEPTLLLSESTEVEQGVFLMNEEGVVPNLNVENKDKSKLWYLDNDASNHMTGEREKFKELNTNVTGRVKFGDGSTVEIRGKGTILFKCKNGEDCLLRDVYYIPTLCNNIISLGQLSEAGNKVVLKGDYLWVYGKGGQLLMRVKRSANRLYKIILEEGQQQRMLTKAEVVTWT